MCFTLRHEGVKEPFEGEYCFTRCELVVSLGAQILDLENQVARTAKDQQTEKKFGLFPAGASWCQQRGVRGYRGAGARGR